jgi:hypothetical protein
MAVCTSQMTMANYPFTRQKSSDSSLEILYHLGRLTWPDLPVSSDEFGKHVSRSLAVGKSRQTGEYQLTEWVAKLRLRDWWLAMACLQDADKVVRERAWTRLMAGTVPANGRLLTESLAEKARLVHRNDDEARHRAVAGFWGRIAAMLTTLEFDSLAKIGQVDAPLLMLHGSADNTVAVELGRRLRSRELHGITCPLLTKSDGTKMGKTASGAIWLDPRRTSPYRFYQYWINLDDDDAGRCLALIGGDDGLQANVLLVQDAQSDLRGAHKLVEDIDVPRQFFCHGYDNADHVCVVCKN